MLIFLLHPGYQIYSKKTTQKSTHLVVTAEKDFTGFSLKLEYQESFQFEKKIQISRKKRGSPRDRG